MIIFTILAAIGKAAHARGEDEIILMKQIKAKDSQALEKLYELYNRLLFGMIISIVKDREEAEDLLQEVFVKIWEKAPTFSEEKGNVYSWVVTITRNKAIDRLRSKDYKTRQKTSANVDNPTLHFESSTNDPLETTIFADRSKLVKKALKKIPRKQRKVITIAYYQGMTQAEIAEHLDIPLGTVKTRMRQGMLKLKDLLEAHIHNNG